MSSIEAHNENGRQDISEDAKDHTIIGDLDIGGFAKVLDASYETLIPYADQIHLNWSDLE